MSNWYQFTPVDTLFFKGASPMALGENHTAFHVFPPPAHTIAGAIRTAALIQNKISFDDFGSGKTPSEIYDAIGQAGTPAPFGLIGPFFMLENTIYIPAPYSWFKPKDSFGDKVKLIKGKPLKSRLLKSASSEFLWAKDEKGEIVSLGGMWIKKEDLHSNEAAIEAKNSTDFFKNEPRTGIALEKNRRVREGHLYSFNHARLKKDVSLVFGTDRELPIEDQGVLKIGAEQRFGWYQKMPEKSLEFEDNGNLYATLSILEGNDMANRSVVATGKILYFGGWDLHTGFHKPMKGFFPAGTVFNQKINNNCITIKGV
ncbi:MAG: hypothetical protein C0403_12055 [Desulfobacterium sp.]|nr:hypothetical protein [Desulfobacterium sp.]